MSGFGMRSGRDDDDDDDEGDDDDEEGTPRRKCPTMTLARGAGAKDGDSKEASSEAAAAAETSSLAVDDDASEAAADKSRLHCDANAARFDGATPGADRNIRRLDVAAIMG